MASRRISEAAKRSASVAATGTGQDPDGAPLPSGEVHGWWAGQDETVCGLSLRRSQLVRFSALLWPDVQPASGGEADLVRLVCPRCASALTPAAGTGWQRTQPRP